MTDEQRIRDLIERWAAAVHAGDMATVLADHAADIVMFDVPPPEQGVRGIDAYRDSWPGFFEWQASGATFEIESLEVTAGTDVAFAFALLRRAPADQLVRGIDAYRDSWPGFVEWQASGATFESESLEVTAGTDVAFAFALLRCATADQLARDPERRLRLTIGLRKADGRWLVSHEHHSFT